MTTVSYCELSVENVHRYSCHSLMQLQPQSLQNTQNTAHIEHTHKERLTSSSSCHLSHFLSKSLSNLSLSLSSYFLLIDRQNDKCAI